MENIVNGGKDSRTERTALVLGEEGVLSLKRARVVVFGLGGVGSYTAEALARAGIGALDIIDADVIEESNINRQLYALNSTIGRAKVQVAKERILDINSTCCVRAIKAFYLPGTEGAAKIEHLFEGASYIADAVDTVAAKVGIIMAARAKGVRVISCMGTGNKVDPSQLCIDDISKTSVCPLARAVRHALKEQGVINGVRAVYSKEKRLWSIGEREVGSGHGIVGSVSFVPPVAGMMMAGEVVRALIGL